MRQVDRKELRRLAQLATPGVWLADGDETNQHCNVTGHFIAHAKGGRIGQAFSNCLVSDEECRANARFMAAANATVVLKLLDYAEALEGLYRMHKQTETREMRSLKDELEQLRPKAECVDDCAHLIRKLVHRHRQLAVDGDLADRALDYLKRKGLQGNPLRACNGFANDE